MRLPLLLISLTFAVSFFFDQPARALTPASNFGYAGQRGNDGYAGPAGRDGDSQTITVTGQPVSVNLSGEYGRDGGDGRDGIPATSCYQPQAAQENLFGADGGDGGNAGLGGSGGSGGDLTIFTDSLTHLRSVYAVADPGGRGRSGRPGHGGRPCYCQTHSWVVHQCDNQLDTCKDLSFTCRDGDPGRDGDFADRQIPDTGNRGTLTVIPQLGQPAPVAPRVTVPMTQLLQGPFTVSENVWVTRYGANQLLAAGSRMADNYRLFDHRAEYQIAFAWEDSRPLSDFAARSFDVTASVQDGRAYPQLNGDIWYQAREENRQGVLTVVFEKVIYRVEAEQLKLSVEGSGPALLADIDDGSGRSDGLQSIFKVKLTQEKFIGGKTVFNGVVPAQAIQKTGNRFVINLANLPGVDQRALTSGNRLDVSVDVTRSLGAFSETKNLSAKYRVP